MRRLSALLVVLTAALLAGGCGSSGRQRTDVQATVTSVDADQKRIDVDVSYANNPRPNSTESAVAIYYDNRTRVVYRGRDYRPNDLERGDQISVHGVNNSGRYLADTITVTRNVRQ